MDNVRAFDIPVDDMRRARRFYERIFGWKIHPIPGSGGDFHAAHTVPVDENDEPKGPILDIAFFAVVKDTEGNAIGLWEDVKK